MRSVAPMRAAKIGYIVMSLILCVLGTVLIAVPDFSLTAVGVICGAVMIVFGIIRLIGYFSKDLYRLAFQYDLTLGIVMIILGAVMLFRPGSLIFPGRSRCKTGLGTKKLPSLKKSGQFFIKFRAPCRWRGRRAPTRRGRHGNP